MTAAANPAAMAQSERNILALPNDCAFKCLARCRRCSYGSAINGEGKQRRMAGNLIDILPADHASGQFLGRAQSPAGPCVVAIRGGEVFDLTEQVATVAGAV